MSQNSLLIIVCFVGYLVTAVLQHFGLLSGVDPNFVYGALTSALGVTGAIKVNVGSPVTVKPSTVVSQGSNGVPTNSPVNDIVNNTRG